MIKIETETYILGDRGFRYKVGNDVAFKYRGSYYIGIIDSIDEKEGSFSCSSVMKDKKSIDNTKFYVKYVEDICFAE